MPSVGFCRIFRFATGFDVLLMILGSLGAIAMGAAMPAFAFIWGQMIDNFEPQDGDINESLIKQTR